MRISDWSSDVCSSDLRETGAAFRAKPNMTGVLVGPILGPYGCNRLSIALNATHHVNLPTSMRRRRPRKAQLPRASKFREARRFSECERSWGPSQSPETRNDCPLQTKAKLRISCGRPLVCGLNLWIGSAMRPRPGRLATMVRLDRAGVISCN